MKKCLCRIAILCAAISLLCAFSPVRANASDRPNVVLIMTDDQGYGDLACHGHPFLKTPNLDQLYGESVRLTNYHVSPKCSPTRAALLTGRHCRHVGVKKTGGGKELIARGVPTLANLFAGSGYRTGIFGKWHLGDLYPYRPQERGFDEVIVHGAGAITTASDLLGNDYFDDRYWHNGQITQYKGYCTEVWFDGARRFIKASQEAGKPFFCYIPTNVGHGPFYAPKDYIDMYERRPGKAAYFGAITHLDKCVGELRAFLREQGLADNTIFIFTTDNGAASGARVYNAGMRGKKGSPYEGGHRVPFFIHWPRGGWTGGRDAGQLAAHLDVLPTLVDACRLKMVEGCKPVGVSLKPVLDGSVKSLGDRTIVESFRGVVMTERWRLVQPNADAELSARDRQEQPRGVELYDITKDPGQKNNVASKYSAVVSTLQAELEKVNKLNYTQGYRYIIGSDKQNPMTVRPLAWTNMLDLGWWQSGIINGQGKPGTLLVETARAGTYRFSLKRWPIEMQQPITSAARVLVPANDYGGTEARQGKALPVRKARLVVGDFDQTIDVTDDMVEAVFNVSLEKGEYDVQAEFLDDQSKQYPVYYLDIERLSLAGA